MYLHSTMFLLHRFAWQVSEYTTVLFTFHYVSITSYRGGKRETAKLSIYIPLCFYYILL